MKPYYYVICQTYVISTDDKAALLREAPAASELLPPTGRRLHRGQTRETYSSHLYPARDGGAQTRTT